MTPKLADEEYTSTERGGIITYFLMRYRGQKFTTKQLARLVGSTENGTYKILCKLARRLPICQEQLDGDRRKSAWVIY